MPPSDHDNGKSSGARDSSGPLGGDLSRLKREPESMVLDLETQALFEGLTLKLASERGLAAWLRSRATAVRAMLAASVIGAVVLLVATRWLRRDISVYPHGRMALALVALGVLLTCSLAVLLRPLQRPALPTWMTPAVACGSIFGLLGLALLPEAHHAHRASVVYGEGVGFQLLRAAPCIVIGLTPGVLIYGLLAALDRGGSQRGALPAIAAGLAANIVLQLVCPVTAPTHMVLGHFGVLLLLIGLGSLRKVTP